MKFEIEGSGTVFGYWQSIHSNINTHWVYDETTGKLKGIQTNDNKYYLDYKYFTSRYRNLNCDYCNKKRQIPKVNPYLVCKSCKSATYCNRKCQKLGWRKGHKQRCKYLKYKYDVYCYMYKK